MNQAAADYPEYTFHAALTPSEQKAAFHVTDEHGKHLCLKIINPNSEAARLEREVRALLDIQHDNVVKLVKYTCSLSPSQQRHYMVEQFVDGTDLSDALVAGQSWAVRQCVNTFSFICDGLAAVHRAGVIHRDLKPSNIRVQPNGRPVIIDFGLARHLDLPALTRQSVGGAVGTPLYFAPEQWTGSRDDIDQRTDLFAVGVLLYQALVGQHPFYARPDMTGQNLMDAVCDSSDYLENPSFVSLSTEWRMLTSRLLKKERAERPSSAEQVAKLLRRIGGGV